MTETKGTNGGARKGAGRPKGSVSKLDSEARLRAYESGLLPLDYLLGIMRDEANDFDRRIDAAKAAAPYVHARLQSVQHSGDGENPINLVHRLERVIVDPRKG